MCARTNNDDMEVDEIEIIERNVAGKKNDEDIHFDGTEYQLSEKLKKDKD